MFITVIGIRYINYKKIYCYEKNYGKEYFSQSPINNISEPANLNMSMVDTLYWCNLLEPVN